VLGYLIAGALIGPFGLRFVEDVESILHFSEFGVVLMLFLIGLELDVKRLAELKRPVFGGGGAQMLLSAILLGGGLLLVGLPWQAALAAGLALAMSSTAVAVQTMTEHNLMSAPLGRAGLGVLLFQDIAAIPLIALVPLLGAGTADTESGWLLVGRALAAVGGVIFIGRFLTRPLMRLIAKVDVREIFTAFALLLVIGIAQLMTYAGLSMALGAFLAGVLLASSEYRHALETDIAPFKGLLLGLFFIAVGMSIDFAVVLGEPALLALLVVGLLGLKAVVLAWLAPRLDVAREQRWLFAAVLAQGGEFAFVVFGAARDARVLAPHWEALLTAAVAVSMALTPLLVLTHDKLCARRVRSAREADAIEAQDGRVIIAGFGRYGQIIGRLLIAQGVRPTVLDHDPDQIEMLRRFDYQVFYGDATRLDLLEAAGAAQARLLVLAIDDIDDSLRLVDAVRSRFPQLPIVARARNVRHWLELAERGVQFIERETFESALRTGRQALEVLGLDPYAARQIADDFRRQNLVTLHTMQPHFHDEARTVAIAKSGRLELEENLRRDREARAREGRGEEWR
jgi:glutathione-regulated potassium-efflux system ancillary protein KefC